MRYIALLRGVNIGGRNKISMPALREAMELHGFFEVSTYINSGNVLFSCGGTDTAAMAERCQAVIRDTFELDIPVTVISSVNLAAALAHAPTWWNTDENSKHNAIFVIPPATPAEICATVGAIKPEYENVSFHGQVIFWSAPLKTFFRSRWSSVAGTAAYGRITIRNANTTLKLALLSKE